MIPYGRQTISETDIAAAVAVLRGDLLTQGPAVEAFERRFAEKVGAQTIIRGLRAVSDFEYEFQMVGMNMQLNREIETVFLMAGAEHQSIASRLVKEIASLGGDISHFTSPYVMKKVIQRMEQRKAAAGRK